MEGGGAGGADGGPSLTSTAVSCVTVPHCDTPPKASTAALLALDA